jgi:hypothetical protein
LGESEKSSYLTFDEIGGTAPAPFFKKQPVDPILRIRIPLKPVVLLAVTSKTQLLTSSNTPDLNRTLEPNKLEMHKLNQALRKSKEGKYSVLVRTIFES